MKCPKCNHEMNEKDMNCINCNTKFFLCDCKPDDKCDYEKVYDYLIETKKGKLVSLDDIIRELKISKERIFIYFKLLESHGFIKIFARETEFREHKPLEDIN